MTKKFLQTSALTLGVGVSIISLGADTSPVRGIHVEVAPEAKHCIHNQNAYIMLHTPGGDTWGIAAHAKVPGTMILKAADKELARDTYEEAESENGKPLAPFLKIQLPDMPRSTDFFVMGAGTLEGISKEVGLSPKERTHNILEVLNSLKMTITSCPNEDGQIGVSFSRK